MRRLALIAAVVLAAAARSHAAGPAPSNWPMARHDAQLTSSSTFAGSDKLSFGWITDIGAAVNGTPLINQGVSLDENGAIFVSNGDKILALSPSGATLWSTTFPGGKFTQPAVGDNGQLYVSSNNAIIAISTQTGSLIWQVAPQGMLFPDLLLSPNQSAAFRGLGSISIAPSGNIFAASGDAQATSASADAIVTITPAGSVAGGVVGCESCGIGLNPGSLGPDSGRFFETFGTGQPFNLNPANLSNNGTGASSGADWQWMQVNSVGPLNNAATYTAYQYSKISTNYFVRQLDPTGMSKNWDSDASYPLTNVTYGLSPLVAGGTVYVLNNGSLYSFKASDGTNLVHASMGILSSGSVGAGNPGPMTLAGNSLYFVARDSSDGIWKLFDVDALAGTIRWKLDYGQLAMGGSFSDASAGGPEVSVSSSSLFFPVIRGGGWPQKVLRFDYSNYVGVAVSSNSPSFAGSVYTTTVTVAVTDSSLNPVASVPVQASAFASPDGNALSPAVNVPQLTDASGKATLQVNYDFSTIPHADYQTLLATVTVAPIGSAPQAIVVQDVRASTYTVTFSTPSIEDDGVYITRYTTVTFTVSNSTGGRVPGWPVALDAGSYNYRSSFCGTIATTTANFGVTDSTGQAQIGLRIKLQAVSASVPQPCISPSDFTNFTATATAYALGMAPQVIDTRENRTSLLQVQISSPVIQADVRTATITVTAWTAGMTSTVPYTIVALNGFSLYNAASNPAVPQFRGYFIAPSAPSQTLIGYTDAFGNATFPITLSGDSIDQYNDYTATFPVFGLNVAVSTPTILIESNFLSSYTVTAATSSFVGEPFVSTVTALNSHGHRLALYGESGVTLTPLFDGTNVQGSGALGTNSISFSGSGGQVVISSQTYNKIENIQIKATRGSGSIKTGLSGTLVMLGPVRYIVSVPTGAPAGQVFGATITAVDNGNNPVVGYGATLSVTPVVALATSTPASGTLTPATVNLPANGTVFVNNFSYSKGDAIQIKVADSALGISGFSSSMTITQPALTIDHYHITMATSITVGSPFNFDVEPQDASSAPVSYSLSRTLNVQAVLAGTNIAGSGSLGVTTLPLASGATYSFTASQTYNKIESVQLKVTDDDGRVGITSYTVTFNGPTQFVVTVATNAQAGVPFQFVVQAQDSGNNPVLGYSGTVNISAVDSVNTSLSGGGVLGVTSLNLSGGTGSSSFQSYTKAQGIRFRVTDSGIGVTTISSSMTVVAGPAASLTLSGNPQSTVATVPSVLTAQAADAFNNPIMGSTVTFTVASGSAVVTLGLVAGAVPASAGVVSTQAPTNVSGAASAFFGSTTTLFSQGDLVVATLGGLTATTTIYNAVLVTNAGGVVGNESNPMLTVNTPASTWGFNVRMSVSGKSELSASDLALTTAAFAASANTFISTTVMKVDVVRDASPSTLAGAGSKLVSVALPYTSAGGNVTVGSYRGQSLLVPQSVLRVFKLNKQTSVFEMVLDGVNLPQGNGTVQAQVSDPEGIFALGAPPYVTLGGTSSGTVTTALASGAQAVVSVPFGSFSTPTTLTVSPLSSGSIPALPGGLNLAGTGIAISVNTNGIEPVNPVSVSLGYTAAAIGGLNPNQLRIARYDAGVGWKVLESQVDTAGDTVVAQTDGFSIFEIVAASPSSSVGAGFVFPNPFRPSLGHTNIKFAGLPAAAHIKIFTVSGRLLQELDADSTGSVLSWKGTDKDGRPLASGVYLAVIKDTTGGSGTATIKFAVQR